MELPHMGTHCSDSFCKQLDYLPMKCDACNELFCKDHLPWLTAVCRILGLLAGPTSRQRRRIGCWPRPCRRVRDLLGNKDKDKLRVLEIKTVICSDLDNLIGFILVRTVLIICTEFYLPREI